MRFARFFVLAVSAVAVIFPVNAGEPESDEAGITDAQKVAFMKHWIGSKFAIKEFCKSANPDKAAEFEAAWINSLVTESADAKAYAASPEIAVEGAGRLKEYTNEAKRSASAREGLMMSCDGALIGKTF